MPVTLHAFDSEAVWYAPDFGDNRDSSDPMIVKILPATRQDLQRIDEQHSRVTRGKANPARRIDRAVCQILSTYAPEIKGLSIRMDDGTIHDVTSGAQLAEESYAPDSLLYDIVGAIRDKSELEEGARKNFG